MSRSYQFGQVIVVWMLDTVHQGLVSHSGYIYMVSQYGNVSFLSHVEASLEVRQLVHYAFLFESERMS